jgi:type IV secretory pathway VirB10-like protein
VIARVLAATLLVLALPAAAAMYKWVDEKGVTHYSETPPPEGTAAKKIDIAPPPPSSGSTGRPETADDWKTRELEYRQRRLKKESAEAAEKAKADKTAADRKNLCVTAQNKLDILQGGGGIYHLNERGERVFLSDDERAAEISKWRVILKGSCDS